MTCSVLRRFNRSHTLTFAALALCAALTGLTVAASAASAGPSTPAYPPAPPCAISTSVISSGPNPELGVTGTGFRANEVLTIVMHSATAVPLGTVTANGSGSFSTSVALPAGTTGTHSLSVTGESCPADPDFTVASAGSTSTTPSSGSLAYTGVAIAGYSVAAALLIGGGVFLLVLSRRRHHTS